MKKIICALFLFVFSLQTSATSQEVITTQFDSPFDTLAVEACWKLDDQDKNSLSFEHCEDSSIEWGILRGNELSKKVSIEKLFKQIKKAHGKISKISVLVSSFPAFNLYRLYDIDHKLENYQIVNINGLQAIKAYYKIIDEDDSDWNVYYLFLIDNRLYVVDFIAPETKFLEWEPLFEATVKSLIK